MSLPEEPAEVSRLAQLIGAGAMAKAGSVSENAERDKALEDLVAFCEADPRLSKIMKARSVGQDDLIALVKKLEDRGAAYWVKGRYVPVAAVSIPEIFGYCLMVQEMEDLNTLAINQILGYFDGIANRLRLPSELLGG